MPTTRRKRDRHARFRVTAEVLEAYRVGDVALARRLLGLRPWEWGDGPLYLPEGEPFDSLAAELEVRRAE